MRRTEDGIAYDCVGRSGPPVVLIMGYGMRGIVWRSQIAALSERCRVVYLDNRGIGESVAIASSEWSMRSMARDVATVLDAAGCQSAHVAGVSMGGMIAQEFALSYPDRCLSLALISTHSGGSLAWVPPVTGIVNIAKTSLASSAERELELRKQLLYPRDFLERVDPELMTARIAEMGVPSSDTARKQFRAIVRHDTKRRLRHLRVPTLIAFGALDRIVSPKHSRELQRSIAGSTIVRFHGAGHGVLFQCAAEISQRMYEHIAAADARVSALRSGPKQPERQLGA